MVVLVVFQVLNWRFYVSLLRHFLGLSRGLIEFIKLKNNILNKKIKSKHLKMDIYLCVYDNVLSMSPQNCELL